MNVDHNKYLTRTECRHLIDNTKARAALDLKHGRVKWVQTWMIIDFALQSGLRVSEMALIKGIDLDLDRGAIQVYRLKRAKRKQETLPISKELTRHLKEFLQWKGEHHTHLFVGKRGPLTASGLQRIWKVAIKHAGIRHTSIHTARHTYATHLLQKTGNLRLVQRQLGHSSPVTTANMYCGVDFEAAQKALGGLY